MYPHDGTPVPVEYETYVGACRPVGAALRNGHSASRSTMGINVCFNGRTFRPNVVAHQPLTDSFPARCDARA